MDKKTQDVFIKAAEEKFAFLLEKGFKGPVLQYKWPQTKVYFIGNNLAIECVLDEKDYFVGCYISKVINGQPAQAHAFDHGVRVRYLLHSWVSDGVKIPASYYSKVSIKMNREEAIPILLDNNLRLLEEYGQQIMEDSPNIFPDNQAV